LTDDTPTEQLRRSSGCSVEVLFRMPLIGYLYGITNERRLVEEVNLLVPDRPWLPELEKNRVSR
jgi:hypothetical protein